MSAMIHELRHRMHEARAAMETASRDWEVMRNRIEHAEGPGSVEAQIARKHSEPLKDLFAATTFHRDLAATYAALLTAEILYRSAVEVGVNSMELQVHERD